MASNVNAIKDLFIALGGSDEDVAGATTIVDVLNAISAKYDGADGAKTNAGAVANITEVADNIGGGSGDFDTATVAITNSSLTGVEVVVPVCVDDDDGGTVVGTVEVGASDTASIKVPLYKGTATMHNSWGSNLTVTGMAEVVDDNIVISGDCGATIGGGK